MKTLILYILTVGIMLAGLIFILEAGKRLKAPEDVSGVWYTGPEFLDQLHTSCASIQSEDPTFTIEQSGMYVSVLLNDADAIRLKGKLLENKLHASCSVPVKNKNCGSETKLELRSEFYRNENGILLITGGISSPLCPDCQTIYFTAQRKMEVE